MKVLVFNGWAASVHAWDLCTFRRDALFSYTDQLAGLPERMLEGDRAGAVLVGWSMGGSSALRMLLKYRERIRGLVLVAATPRMMRDEGWSGMSPRRLEALKRGLELTRGEGFFGVPEGKPNPYMMDCEENLNAGLKYLVDTDLRAGLESLGETAMPVYIFQSERDGIVKADNAVFLKKVFPQAHVELIPGFEHALPIEIPEKISAAVESCAAMSEERL